MKVIILAGGGGTRLFPLSRQGYPKQFLNVDGDLSLLSQTVKRFLGVVKSTDVVVVTNKEYHHHVKADLSKIGVTDANILLEPVSRNTAPAIALAAKFCIDELNANQEEVLFVTPADHIIRPLDQFTSIITRAAELAKQNLIVTLGIRPDKPETGYGYIQAGRTLESGFYVQSFKEKPNKTTAEQYVRDGNYYWNSGMFAMTIQCLMDEFATYEPAIYNIATLPCCEVYQKFAEMPNISIDYAIAERSKRVAMLSLHTYWNDIGSWDAIYSVLDKDSDGNAIKGDCLLIDSHNTLMLGNSRLLAGIGLEDLLVVETADVILVAKQGESQKVKELVTELKKQGRREAEEHTTAYRPWGSYTVLGEGPGYKMKKLVVTPGHQLNLQLHHHRSEHWIVIHGTARVAIGDTEKIIHENESVFIPKSTLHRLENPGKISLEIIEVQNGAYLEEDDIVRFDDV